MMPGPSTPRASRRLLHKGRKFDFEILEYPGKSGKTVVREVVRHPGAVLILPIMDDGRVVLIQNYRAALDRSIYELPAGTLEPPEPPEACARRELIEETGFEAATVSVLGRFYTSPGLSDEQMWAYVAVGLTHVGQRLEDGEEATVWPVTADQAMRMIDSGELSDAKSMLALLMARQRSLI
jgi:ADP-ribose pyrophosphatase